MSNRNYIYFHSFIQLQRNNFNMVVLVGSKIDLLFECVVFIQYMKCKKIVLIVDEAGI